MARLGRIPLAVVQRAIEREADDRRSDSDNHWAEYLQELWESTLSSVGLGDIKLRWSGFCCQGDGASFTAKVTEAEQFVRFLSQPVPPSECIDCQDGKELFAPWLWHQAGMEADPQLAVLLEEDAVLSDFMGYFADTGGHYLHEYTVRFYADEPYRVEPAYTEAYARLARFGEQLRHHWSTALYRGLEAEYGHYCSEERIIEDFEGLEAEFTRSGVRV